MIPILIIGAGVFLADTFLKTYLYDNHLSQSIPVIKNILHITVIQNQGAAFGILQGKSLLLIYVGIVFILIFFFFINSQKKKDTFFVIASGLVLGGAISNLCDRLFVGGVIDYIDFRVWPVFNLSDSCITTGIGIFILDSFLAKKVKDK